jgi:hypothetical protein
MNKREQEIFLRGIALGLKASEDFEAEFPSGFMGSLYGMPVYAQENIKVNNKNVKKTISKVRKILGKFPKRAWTEDEDNYILENMDGSMKSLARKLKGRSESAIAQRKMKLVIKNPKAKKTNGYKGLAKLNQNLND